MGAVTSRKGVAERVCVLYSWTGAAHPGTDREKALHELWSDWVALVGTDFISPDAHPELNDARIAELARRRDLIRQRTLAAIKGQTPEPAPETAKEE